MNRFFIAAAVIFAASVTTVSADSLGQSVQFRTNTGYDALGASEVSATLRAVGGNAYWYVDDRYWALLSAADRTRFESNIAELSRRFDTEIYPKSRALWGSEASPGADGDARVTILLERLIAGSGGYFETIHHYPRSRAPESNVREMVFVNAISVLDGRAAAYTAHELQHLISFNQKEILLNADDDTWLNEARSEYSSTVAAPAPAEEFSVLDARVASFLRTPSDSLVLWPNTATDYGIASVFAHYLVERFSESVLSSTIRSGAAGVPAVNEALRVTGTSRNFAEVFNEWMVAVYLNDAERDPRYGYRNTDLSRARVTPERTRMTDDARAVREIPVQEWQPVWHEYYPAGREFGGPLRINISGGGDTQWTGSAVVKSAGGAWSVTPLSFERGTATLEVPHADAESLTVIFSQGSFESADDRIPVNRTAVLTVTVGAGSESVSVPGAAPAPVSGQGEITDGDLIRRDNGETEIYVVWGKYRRYLPAGVLELYGFQNRPVTAVNNATFNRYTTSNYIRTEGDERVYAAWPDGTKHWMNITPAQWDASGRDWGAIFIINDREAAFYATGPDIVR